MQLTEYERGYAQALSDAADMFAEGADAAQKAASQKLKIMREEGEADDYLPDLRQKQSMMEAMRSVMELERTWSKERRAMESTEGRAA
ncbi:MAG: hypothetical protein AAGF30_00280 [Pseudomonadota bacterium]